MKHSKKEQLLKAKALLLDARLRKYRDEPNPWDWCTYNENERSGTESRIWFATAQEAFDDLVKFKAGEEARGVYIG